MGDNPARSAMSLWDQRFGRLRRFVRTSGDPNSGPDYRGNDTPIDPRHCREIEWCEWPSPATRGCLVGRTTGDTLQKPDNG
jgi:hypothetical protein